MEERRVGGHAPRAAVHHELELFVHDYARFGSACRLAEHELLLVGCEESSRLDALHRALVSHVVRVIGPEHDAVGADGSHEQLEAVARMRQRIEVEPAQRLARQALQVGELGANARAAIPSPAQVRRRSAAVGAHDLRFWELLRTPPKIRLAAATAVSVGFPIRLIK